MSEAPQVTDNRDESRFEIYMGGELAELIYRRRDDRLVLVHTRVPDDLGGHGLGGLLVQAALARAKAEELTLVPLCPFARSWLKRRPDAAAGVTVDWADPEF
jgi:predicted GNAT family acetyltransferase